MFYFYTRWWWLRHFVFKYQACISFGLAGVLAHSAAYLAVRAWCCVVWSSIVGPLPVFGWREVPARVFHSFHGSFQLDHRHVHRFGHRSAG